MKELGELKHFRGLEIQRTKEEIFLCQQKYAKDMLEVWYDLLQAYINPYGAKYEFMCI